MALKLTKLDLYLMITSRYNEPYFQESGKRHVLLAIIDLEWLGYWMILIVSLMMTEIHFFK